MTASRQRALGTGIALWDRMAHALAALFRHLPLLAARMAAGGGAEQAVSTSLKITLYLVSIPMAMVTAVLILEVLALPPT